MRTSFSIAQLADPDIAESESILRTCVHCGFCTATCPTYVLLGDELDSPRGRIYLIKDMLESGRPATRRVAMHIDRCLSCLSCMTTCPSGVHYMHLVDHARAHIHETYRRPFGDRALRALLAWLLPKPRLFRLFLLPAILFRPLAPLVGRLFGARAGALLALAPESLPRRSPMDGPRVFPARGRRRARMALMTGCVQTVLSPRINESTVRLLTRRGVEVVVAEGAGCCGALAHHMGREADGHRAARDNVAAWTREIDGDGLDAIVINASGCGSMVKDYGFMLRNDPDWADKAARVSGLTRDVTEVMTGLGLGEEVGAAANLEIAYHSACSMQHGQKLKTQPAALLRAAGYSVREPAESHLCCGSAGVYNLLQPEIARNLRDRKVASIEALAPRAIATGNIGCMTQIGTGTNIPIVHTVELLDWATGGPKPEALERVSSEPAPMEKSGAVAE